MWCRTILTAVAISYVICMLLLSGLQKEDLDAGTLEKLGRHNVNIDDMNNEQQRQECLLGTYLIKGNDTQNNITTELNREALETSTTEKSINNDVNIVHTRADSTVIQNELKIKTENFFGQIPIAGNNMPKLNTSDVIKKFGNITKVEDYNGLKIQYNVENQPDLQTVMNFWSKLTQYTKKVVSKIATTPALHRDNEEKKVLSTVALDDSNNGFIHSTEIEYVSRLLAEYLAGHNVLTTTQTASKQVEPLKTPVISETPDLKMLNKNDSTLNDKINNLTQKIINTPVDPKSMPVQKFYGNNLQFENIQDPTLNNFQIKVLEFTPAMTNILTSILNTLNGKKIVINARNTTSNAENTTMINKNMNKQNNEQQVKRASPNQNNYPQNTGDAFNSQNDSKTQQTQYEIINKDLFETARIKAEKWEAVPNYKTQHKETNIAPIFTKKWEKIRNYEVDNEANKKTLEQSNEVTNAHAKVVKTNTKNLENIQQFIQNPVRNTQTNTNKTEKIKNPYINNNRFKIKSVEEKPKEFQSDDMDTTRYKFMLPSIKNAIQNKKSKTNNEESKTPKIDLNRSDLSQNEEVYGIEFRAVTDTNEPITVSEINYEQYTEKPGINTKLKQNSKEFNDNQLKVTRKSNQDSRNRFSSDPDQIYNEERNRIYVTKDQQPKRVHDLNHKRLPRPDKSKVFKELRKPFEVHDLKQYRKPKPDNFKDDIPLHIPIDVKELKPNPQYNQKVFKVVQPFKDFKQNEPRVPGNFKEIQSLGDIKQNQQPKREQTSFIDVQQPPLIEKNFIEERKRVPDNLKEIKDVRQPIPFKVNVEQPIRFNVKDLKGIPQSIPLNVNIEQTIPFYVNEYQNRQPIPGNLNNLKKNQQLILVEDAKGVKKIEQATPNRLKDFQNVQQPQQQFNEKNFQGNREPTLQDFKQNEEPLPDNMKKIKQNIGPNIYDPQVITANIIKEIAEKVKQIVLKDMEKKVTTMTAVNTTRGIATPASATPVKATPPKTNPPSTANPTTLMKNTVTTTEKPPRPDKDINAANIVINKLMEMIDEFKAMKETAKLSSQVPLNFTASQGTTKEPKLPLQNQMVKGIFNPLVDTNRPSYKTLDSNPYAPRVFPLVASPKGNPPPNWGAKYVPQVKNIQKNEYHSGAITIQTNSDEIPPLAIQITQPLKIMNQHIVVTTKRPNDKRKEEHERNSKNRLDRIYRGPYETINHREKLQYQSKVRFADNYNKSREYSDRYSYKSRFIKDREKPWYNHRIKDNIHRFENRNRGSPTYAETADDTDSYNRPRSVQPVYQYELNNENGIRPQTGPYKPRYDSKKYHEKLERIENWPRNTWKEFIALKSDDCEDIPARQQMPITKIKQRTRFDDSHFTNFLKSQQKVTDMLEKILATNIKNGVPTLSVETQ